MIPLPNRSRRMVELASATILCVLLAACERDTPTGTSPGPIGLAAKPTGGDPIVLSTDPSTAPQDTTLDIAVTGSNFASGSRVDLAIDGVPSDEVQTNSTTFVDSELLIANVTIAADAVPERYDVLVTSKGKRGIGIELFEVTLNPGRTNLYTITFGGDLEGTVSEVIVDFRDPLKQITTNGVTFRPVLASGDRSKCRRINGKLVTATEWGPFSGAGWLGVLDLSRRSGGSFHLQLVGDQQDAAGGFINLVVNHEPLTDTVSPTTGIAFTEFRDARALIGLTSWADVDASGEPIADGDDRCINFTITATPSAIAPH